MAWYRSGTVTVANGSTTVTGAGTAFVANVSQGEGFLGPDGRVYEIVAVVSNTVLTLAAAYQGASAGGQGYAILPTQSALADLAAEAAELVASFAAVRDGPGAGLFPDGTVGAPALRFAADQDTGLFRQGNDALGVALGGTERFRLTSVGLAVGWQAVPLTQVHVAGAGTVGLYTGGATTSGSPLGAQIYLGDNPFQNAQYFNAAPGIGATFDAGSGNAAALGFYSYNGAAGTRPERMRITSVGRVGIATTAPAAPLHVFGTGGILTSGGSYTAPPAGHGGIIGVGTLGVVLTGSGTTTDFYLANKNGSGVMEVPTGTTDALFNGTIGVGAAPAGGTMKIDAAGNMRADQFHCRASTAVPSVDAAVIRPSDNTIALVAGGVVRLQANVGGVRPGTDNQLDLGASTLRWTQLFAATATIGTSDEREKTWRGELTDDEYAAGLRVIDELGFYQWNDAVADKGDDARYHFGARAQRVWAVFADAGLVDPIKDGKPGKTPYSFLCFDEWGDETRPVYETRTRTIKHTVATVEEYKSGKRKGEPKTRVVETQEEYEHDTGKVEIVLKAGNRYGLRQGDLALFLVAVQSRRQAEIERRLAALEK